MNKVSFPELPDHLIPHAEKLCGPNAKKSLFLLMSSGNGENGVLGIVTYRLPAMMMGEEVLKWDLWRDADTKTALDPQPGEEPSAAPAAPRKAAPKKAKGETMMVSIDLIDKCPLNPRKRFKRERLEPLKGSIKTHGFMPEMSRLWVRPSPVHRNRYELVDGERREIVVRELKTEGAIDGIVPIVVSDLTDAQVLEYMLLNAREREELSPIEEADGICRLLEIPDAAGKLPTLETVATQLGINESHIRQCVHLRKLRGTPAGEALEEERISIRHAILLARIADPKTRDSLTRRVLKPTDGRGVIPAEMLNEWIVSEVQVDLRGAEFDHTDAELVPLKLKDNERVCGGACGTKNEAANQMDWQCPFAEVQGRAVRCLNPECFRLKVSAAYEKWRREVAELATASGENVVTITAEETAKLWDNTGKRLAPNSGYVELSAKPEGWELKAGEENPPTWRAMLKNSGTQILVVKDTAGKQRDLVKRELAKQAAANAGHDIFAGVKPATAEETPAPAPAPAPTSEAPAEEAPAEEPVVDQEPGDRRIERAAEETKADIARQLANAEAERVQKLQSRQALALSQALAEAARAMKLLSLEFWRLLLAPMVAAAREFGTLVNLCEMLGVPQGETDDDREEALNIRLGETPLEHLPAFALMVARNMVFNEEVAPWLKVACKALGVDVKAVNKRVAGEVAAEEEHARQEAEIEAGVAWASPLLEAPEDFRWTSEGLCENPNMATLAFPKGVKLAAFVTVARTKKGWHFGYEVSEGAGKKAKQHFHSLPNRNETSYGNPALAAKTGLLAVLTIFENVLAPEAATARLQAYIERVKLPAEPKKKAKPKAEKKAPKKGGK